MTVYRDKGQKATADFKKKRAKQAANSGFPELFQFIDHFPLYAGPLTLARFLAIYEIFKKCAHVPGHIVEFGCFKGGNLMFLAKLCQLLQPASCKSIFGFDSFEGLRDFRSEDAVRGAQNRAGSYKGDCEELEKWIKVYDLEQVIYLVKGNALKTIPVFEKENPHIMFSMAYVDFDLYGPCKAALQFVHHRLSPGGIIVFDEALMHNWPGEGQILAEFIEQHRGEYDAGSIPFTKQPTAFLVRR